MAKTFNTAGPMKEDIHYVLPPRLSLEEIKLFIKRQVYFILHAPRQTGKTTAIIAIVKALRERGEVIPLYVNVESGQPARGNIQMGIRAILSQFKLGIRIALGEEDPAFRLFDKMTNDPLDGLQDFLARWSEISPKPLVIFIDEIDSLIGDTLISVLRQLRTGYINRPSHFPQSICLIGVRDVRDYQIFSEEKQAIVLGGSAFNIKAESLILSNFSREEVSALYRQHTEETGQQFTEEAVEYAFTQTQGQPWLVNALAFQACFRDVTEPSIPITKEVFERARDTLILRRDTHLDALLERLKEPRVARVIDACLSSRRIGDPFLYDDLQYVVDLGLVRMERGNPMIANPIYQEVIPRTLTYGQQARLTEDQCSYLDERGLLNMEKVLSQFTQFYRENSEITQGDLLYKESGPHLLLMAYLQRIINGGGQIEREYALGRGRVDLFVKFRGEGFVIELKIFRGPQTIEEGLEQTASYVDTQGAKEGHLVIFDRSEKAWNDKISHSLQKINGIPIFVWTL